MKEPSADELRELADHLDDLQQHKGWHALVAEAQKVYNAVTTVDRIATVFTREASPERLALATAELVAARATALQLIKLPETLSKQYRADAAKQAMVARPVRDLGPDVELTR